MEDIRASIIVERPTSYKENFVEHKLQSNNGKDLDKTKHSTRRSMDNLLRVDTNFGRHFQVLLTFVVMLHFDKIKKKERQLRYHHNEFIFCLQFCDVILERLHNYFLYSYIRWETESFFYTGNIIRLCDYLFYFSYTRPANVH